MFFKEYQWLHFKSILLGLLVTPYKDRLTRVVKVLSLGGHIIKQNKSLKLIDPVEV